MKKKSKKNSIIDVDKQTNKKPIKYPKNEKKKIVVGKKIRKEKKQNIMKIKLKK